MALLNFFKKPKKEKKVTPHKGALKRTGKEKSVKPARHGKRGVLGGSKRVSDQKDEIKREDERTSVVLKESRTAWRVLAKPHVTEKAAALAAFNQYLHR